MDDDSILKKYPNYEFFKSHIRDNRPLQASDSENKISKEILVQQVIGEESCDTLVEFSVPFPDKYPACELLESQTKINVAGTYILKDTVLLNGLIHKRINYIAFEEQISYEHASHSLSSIIGNQKCIITDIPFQCSMKIPDISQKDTINIEYAGSDPSDVIELLQFPLAVKDVTLYKSVKEKLIVNIHIKVYRTVQIRHREG